MYRQFLPMTTHSNPSLVSQLLMVLSVLLIVFGALGLVFVQNPLQQESFDTRREASVDNGQVLVSFDPDNESFKVGQEARIDILVNTQNLNTTGVELVFNIITETTDELNVLAYSDPNLRIVSQEIEQTSDGFLVSYKTEAVSGRTFLSTSPKPVMALTFTPTRTGDFKLAFDADASVSYKANTTPAQDLLKTVGNETYHVESGSSSSVKACNDSCASNAECPTNHRCFENRCRLVTNVSSSTCSTPPDNGLQRQCNQYCADTRECASGFTCYFNRCRRPDNVESTSCSLPSAALQTAIQQSCNKSCSSNAQCANNMRCFNSQCRLATNPSSTSCSAVTAKSVSGVYYTQPSGPTKGQESDAANRVSPPISTRSGLTATRSAQASGSAGLISPRPSASASPIVRVSPPAVPAITPLPSPTAAGLSQRLNQMFKGGMSLPLIALGAGLVLLVIVVLMVIINALRGRKPSAQLPPAAQKSQAYEQELQQKINTLKSQQPGPTPLVAPRPEPKPPTPPSRDSESVTPPPSTLRTQAAPQVVRPPVASMPTQAAPFRPAPPLSPAKPFTSPMPSTRPQPSFTPRPQPSQPQPSEPVQPVSEPKPTAPDQPSTLPVNRPTSMLERIKQKGITPPGSDKS